jgi:hypothetical protein
MTKARTNASASPAVGRNMIINGAMNVSKRATSVTGVGAAGYFTCDRWKIETASSAGRLTMTQTADGPNGISANCLKLDCTTADTSIAALEYLILSQYLEGQNLQRIGKGVSGAKQVTISFYVKANAAFDFVAEIRDFDNGRTISKLFATTTDWVRHEILIPADVDDGSSPFDDDNASSAVLNFWLHAGSNYTSGTLATEWANLSNTTRAAGIDSFFSSTDNNFFITGVQMEVGPVATEFEQEDIGVTLEKCKRYYRRIGNTGDASVFQMLFSGFMGTANRAYGSLMLSPSMRTQPTMGTTGTATHYAIMNENANTACSAVPALDGQTSEQTVFIIQDTGTDLTVGQGVQVRGNSNVTAHIAFDAEL